MSLRVGWNFGSTAEDECQDVVMQDPPCWAATSAVLKAGRGLSSWLFSNLSPPSSPLVSSFFCKDPFSPRQLSNPGCPSQPVAPHPPYPSPATSFIDKLPQELLEEIFREYVHGPTAASPSPNNPLTGSFRRIVTAVGSKTTPFSLAHVCSSWRAIIVSNSSLWARVCAFRPEARDIPLFECWLSRSSSSPLSLTVIQKAKNESVFFDDTAFRVLSTAAKHSYRWETVCLQLDQDSEPPLAELSTHTPLPSLRSFRLNLCNWSSQGSQTLSRLLSSSPELEDVAWGNMCQITPFIPNIPWAMLRKVQLGHASLLDLSTILPLTTTLESLSIDFFHVDCPTDSAFFRGTTPPINLPNLTSLKLTQYDDVSPLFNLLQLPSLSTLSLESGLGSNVVPHVGWSAVADLIHRSGCIVTALQWSDNLLDETLLIEYWSATSATLFSNIVHLRIESPVSNQFVEALTLHSDTRAMFASLLSLELRYCRADSTSLRVMLSSRPNLRRVDIKVRDEGGLVDHLV